jgi:type I restriction enzyme R subunit
MVRYTIKQITTAEMITKLLDLARWVREAQKHGQELGLTDEETAFYDASRCARVSRPRTWG